MAEEIEEKLSEIYKLPVVVEKKEGRLFYISLGNMFIIPFLYRKEVTLEANITDLCLKIDVEILKIYKKEGKNDSFR